MLPVLPQMFAPSPAVASGAPDHGSAFADGFKINAPEINIPDIDPTRGFSAAFIMQELPKVMGQNAVPVAGEDTDISAEDMVDAGVLFAIQQPVLTAVAVPTDVEVSQTIGLAATAPNVPPTQAILQGQMTDTASVFDQGKGAQMVTITDAGQDALPADLGKARVFDRTMTAKSIDVPRGESLIEPSFAPIAAPVRTDTPAPSAAPVSTEVISDQMPSVAVQSIPLTLGQAPKKTSPFSGPMSATMALSMFQTQIDGQGVPNDDELAAAPVLHPVHTSRKSTLVFARAPDPPPAQPIGDGVAAAVAPDTQSLQTVEGAIPSALEDGADFGAVGIAVDPAGTGQNLVQDRGLVGPFMVAKADVVAPQISPAALPTLPVTIPHLAAQILPHSPAAKNGPIELVLNPSELGHLRFEIHQKGENVQVVLSAERPETLDLLRRNGEQLAIEFRNAGFSGASLSFGQWGRSSDGQPPASFIVQSEDDFGPIILPQTVKTPLAQDNSRNLNLRL